MPRLGDLVLRGQTADEAAQARTGLPAGTDGPAHARPKGKIKSPPSDKTKLD